MLSLSIWNVRPSTKETPLERDKAIESVRKAARDKGHLADTNVSQTKRPISRNTPIRNSRGLMT